MVNGIDSFKDYFKDYSNNYIIIGGCACDLLFDEAGIDFRLTRDFDVVLIIEALNPGFIKRFWDYIKLGQYKHINKSTKTPQFYRFTDPKDESFPSQIELFSREPDALALSEDAYKTPIPVEDELYSLSAILLNENYYNMLIQGRININGVTIIGAPQLIALKAKAWLDLSKVRANRSDIQSDDVEKHRKDVLRLYRLLTPETKLKVSHEILKDFNKFLNEVQFKEQSLKSLNISASIPEIKERLGNLFFS